MINVCNCMGCRNHQGWCEFDTVLPDGWDDITVEETEAINNLVNDDEDAWHG